MSRAITLVESRKTAHQEMARQLLSELLCHSGRSIRIGITGVPGVGKSTFIDQFGTMLADMGRKVAVLAIDPTSSRHGGSILGDKTRMINLSAHPNSFIRPSPSSGTLGGVTRMTRETIILCEAAGFDTILIETVGVGQSETIVANMSDFFLVLALPGAGDELQGIKKGILELADMIVVNKCDGERQLLARQAAQHYTRALHVLEPQHPDWIPPVALVSAIENKGLDEVWQKIEDHAQVMKDNGESQRKRRHQNVNWMHELFLNRLKDWALANKGMNAAMQELERSVYQGNLLPGEAVDRMLHNLFNEKNT